LFVILGAALLLRAKIGPARIALALVGFGGALLVAQRGVSGMSPAAMLAFGAACLGLYVTLPGVAFQHAVRSR
jgi:drug/metabolite transporter (DMT)-like permease